MEDGVRESYERLEEVLAGWPELLAEFPGLAYRAAAIARIE